MSGTVYTFEYVFDSCILNTCYKYLTLGLSKIKAGFIGKIIYHIVDAVKVLAFFVSYSLLSYVGADGVLRLLDVLMLLTFYLISKWIFGYIFGFIDNILRQIVKYSVIKPALYLHNLLVLVIRRIVRKQMSNYK